jgi:hypothetical protein
VRVGVFVGVEVGEMVAVLVLVEVKVEVQGVPWTFAQVVLVKVKVAVPREMGKVGEILMDLLQAIVEKHKKENNNRIKPSRYSDRRIFISNKSNLDIRFYSLSL